MAERKSKSGLTLSEHRGWRRQYLKFAREAVARRDWRAASNFYYKAAFHAAVEYALTPARKKR